MVANYLIINIYGSLASAQELCEFKAKNNKIDEAFDKAD